MGYKFSRPLVTFSCYGNKKALSNKLSAVIIEVYVSNVLEIMDIVNYWLATRKLS